MRITAHAALLLAGLVGPAGCYRYVPADLAEVSPGRDVRLRVSPEETARFAAVIGPDTRTLEGRVVELTDSELMVEVPVVSNQVGSRIQTLNQRLDLARTGISFVEIRELDRTKTTIAVGGGAAIAGFILVKGLTGAFNAGNDDEGGSGNELVVPVFLRIRF